MAEQVPSIGRVVHYVLPDGPHAGEHRPAFIVQVWTGDYLNLVVFVDGTNDGPQLAGCVLWATSVQQDQGDTPAPRTWHWPEFVPPKG